ncbi:hypothetical protein LDENG_00158530 [Lucifuga dentata]|nr:hypothetical protein LDENG_00158530 [Lucifuga dentata]
MVAHLLVKPLRKRASRFAVSHHAVTSVDALTADDPSELSNQISAPGILKLFGGEICEGVHYKSVLATTHSSAGELVKEALERYGVGKEEAASYVLCDTIGSIIEHRWRTEGFRVVGDDEKPLLLQSLWKPREGLARRFEIRSRSLVEEKTSKEKDTITAGINAQARRLQKSRSRVTSTLIERTAGRSQNLWRSRSETDLLDSDTESKQDGDRDQSQKNESESGKNSAEPQHDLIHVHNRAERHGEPQAATRREGGERRGDEPRRDTESTRYSIHPPHTCPYLLLLQGADHTQDFLIYLLTGSNIVIGRQSERGEGRGADVLLAASDILPRHCCFHRHGASSHTVLRSYRDATVTRNGEVLTDEVRLSAGDVIGLGQRYLFLFKDPSTVTHTEVKDAACLLGQTTSAATANHSRDETQRHTRQRPRNSGPPFLTSPEGHSLPLSYETEDEDHIIREIVAMATRDIPDRPPLTVAFLMCVCVRYSAACLRTSDLRRLLLLIASQVQNATWEHTTELAALQPEVLNGPPDPESVQRVSLEEVISGLRPLVVWMSNSLELLHFIQHELPLLLEGRSSEEEEEEEKEEDEGEREDEESREEQSSSGWLERRLSSVRLAREETVAVLEEVVMLTFQQCVYYITKVLYPVLPGLLDCNPLRGGPDVEVRGQRVGVLAGGGLQVGGETEQVVEVLTEAWRLFVNCQLHPEVSSQLLAFLFYFINASLINALMDRGSDPGFYQRSRAVLLRANLDLILDWSHTAGLGELFLEHTHTLSSAINLLAMPRKTLLQTPWASLRDKYPALSPAQLHHLLSHYSPASPCQRMWSPCAEEHAAAHETNEILVSFDTHQPLVLPDSSFMLGGAAADSGLRDELDRLKELFSSISHSRSTEDSVSMLGNVPTATKLIKMDFLLKAGLETLESSSAEVVLPQAAGQTPLTSSALPASPPSSPSLFSPSFTHHLGGFSSGGVLPLQQKLQHLELQPETETSRTQSRDLEPSCLLTPPSTPHSMDPAGLLRAEEVNSETHSWSRADDDHDEGGFVSECLAALQTDCTHINETVERKEEEEEDGSKDEEVFILELQRGEQGLGLALVDTRDVSSRMKGIFIRTLVPDSPAAQSKKLLPGDQILAVNGVSLLGLDYHR